MMMKNQAEAVQEAVPEAQMPNILTEMQRRAEAQLRIAQDIAVQERDSLIYLKCSILELLTVCEDAFPHAMLVYKNGTVSVSFDDEAGFAPAATVKELADQCDMVLVVGSPNSSNSNRLRELAERMGTPAYLIDGAEDMQRGWFDGVRRIGITAGASAPEVLVRGVIAQLREWGASEEQELEGREENITFSMPKELRVKAL